MSKMNRKVYQLEAIVVGFQGSGPYASKAEFGDPISSKSEVFKVQPSFKTEHLRASYTSVGRLQGAKAHTSLERQAYRPTRTKSSFSGAHI